MSKVAIVCDTTMDLTFEEGKKNNIHVISNGLSVAGKNYNEFIDMDTDQFLAIDATSEIIPKTGAASPGLTSEVYLQASRESKNILVLAMSSDYSGGINIRNMVAQQLNEDFDLNIQVYDTPSIFAGGMPYYKEACRLRDLNYSIEEIIEGLNKISKHTSSRYAGEPYYITEGGRFEETLEELGIEKGDGQYAGVVIEDFHALNWTAKDGKEARQRLLEEIDQALSEAEKDGLTLRLYITGNNDNEDERAFYVKVKETYPELKVARHRLGPIASIHIGHGSFGVVWTPDFE